jgi:hypothetical protein
MGAIVAIIIAVVVGGVVAVGTSVGLVASQGGNGYPEQVPGSVVVYGTE